jgi:Mg-chelatase subunit ChlD
MPRRLFHPQRHRDLDALHERIRHLVDVIRRLPPGQGTQLPPALRNARSSRARCAPNEC